MNLRRLLAKTRYLRHPYLITRAILRPFEVWDSEKHSVRCKMGEYEKYSLPFEKAIEIITNYQEEIMTELRELEGSSFIQHINRCVQQAGVIGGPVSYEDGMLLYALVRALKPYVVVETGVANGVSSSFILKALDRNSRGRLYSIDLHYREGESVPEGRELGWVIPGELRYRWELRLGESTKVLPKLLRELKSIDIFFHDSRHTYKTMMREYRLAWPFLRDKGIIASHDVKSNDAFLDFCDSIGEKPIVVGNMGFVQKS